MKFQMITFLAASLTIPAAFTQTAWAQDAVSSEEQARAEAAADDIFHKVLRKDVGAYGQARKNTSMLKDEKKREKAELRKTSRLRHPLKWVGHATGIKENDDFKNRKETRAKQKDILRQIKKDLKANHKVENIGYTVWGLHEGFTLHGELSTTVGGIKQYREEIAVLEARLKEPDLSEAKKNKIQRQIEELRADIYENSLEIAQEKEKLDRILAAQAVTDRAVTSVAPVTGKDSGQSKALKKDLEPTMSEADYVLARDAVRRAIAESRESSQAR
jgi:hypothetical protein